MHSIIVAYRNRPTHLRLFLEAIEVANKDTKKTEVIIVELLGEDDDHPPVLALPSMLRRWYVEDFGDLFHKSKALNLAVSKATGEYVTVLDIDVLVQPNFMHSIDLFYADPANAKIKLGHRVRLLDAVQTDRIHRFGISHFDYLLENPTLYRFNTAAENYGDVLTGCGLFTMRKDEFVRIGGYDERFVGYGLEDTDFNLRAHKNSIVTKINDQSELFHLHHDRERDWADPVAEEANRKLFHQNIGEGHPNPPKLPPPAPLAKKRCECTRSKA